MRKGEKFAVIDSYQKLCVPIDFLPKLLNEGFLIETEYTSDGDMVKAVKPIDKCNFIEGVDIDMAEAVGKLSQ